MCNGIMFRKGGGRKGIISRSQKGVFHCAIEVRHRPIVFFSGKGVLDIGRYQVRKLNERGRCLEFTACWKTEPLKDKTS